MRSVQIPQTSERSRQSSSSFSDQEGEIILPQPKKSKKVYVCAFFTIVLLIIVSIHIRSSRYEVSNSPFEKQLDEYKQKELVLFPHDTSCYTQGLSFLNSTHLLESCGLYRESYFHILEYQKINEKEIKLKETFKSQLFDDKYFLQGSVYFPKNKMIYILTWRQHTVFRIDADTLKEVDRLAWKKQGWGLTHNNSHLIISDGSSSLFIASEQMEILEEIKVKDHFGKPQIQLNQLEWIQEGEKQYVLANVYTKKIIVKIDLQSGEVVDVMKFDSLVIRQQQQSHIQVLNGIAYNGKNYLLTGKKWGSFYQLQHL